MLRYRGRPGGVHDSAARRCHAIAALRGRACRAPVPPARRRRPTDRRPRATVDRGRRRGRGGPDRGATVRADPLVRPVIDGAFDVGDGRKLYLQCWGEGSPTIVIDAGGGEIQEYREYAAHVHLASRGAASRVRLRSRRSSAGATRPRQAAPARGRHGRPPCAAGRPRASRAARPRRPLVRRFHHAFYANRFAEDVQGVVLLDVPAPSADDRRGRARARLGPSGQRRAQRRRRRLRDRLANEQFPFDAPLLVVTAIDGHRASTTRLSGSTGALEPPDRAHWRARAPCRPSGRGGRRRPRDGRIAARRAAYRPPWIFGIGGRPRLPSTR